MIDRSDAIRCRVIRHSVERWHERSCEGEEVGPVTHEYDERKRIAEDKLQDATDDHEHSAEEHAARSCRYSEALDKHKHRSALVSS